MCMRTGPITPETVPLPTSRPLPCSTLATLLALCAESAGHTGGDDVGTGQEIHHRIEFLDEDPLRARREARELLAEFAQADVDAVLDLPGPAQSTASSTNKGWGSAETVGILISTGSLITSVVQLWLARVPNRTISVTRPDGSTLKISGKQAQEDRALLERFFSAGASGQDGAVTDSES